MSKIKTNIYDIGMLHIMKSGDKITLLEECLENPKYMKVCYDDGTISTEHKLQIQMKKCINPWTPTHTNIGYLGVGKYTGINMYKYKREYVLWGSMLTRCYTESYQKRYPTYIGCSVSPEWLCFNVFCEDLPYLKGYIDWKNGTSKQYHLDKDIKVKDNKVYSSETCQFVKASINTGKAKLTGKTYIATNVTDGHEESFFDMKAWGAQYNIDKNQVGACARGTQPTVHGWKIRIKEDSNG